MKQVMDRAIKQKEQSGYDYKATPSVPDRRILAENDGSTDKLKAGLLVKDQKSNDRMPRIKDIPDPSEPKSRYS